jgi:hypothetical protein
LSTFHTGVVVQLNSLTAGRTRPPPGDSSYPATVGSELIYQFLVGPTNLIPTRHPLGLDDPEHGQLNSPTEAR